MSAQQRPYLVLQPSVSTTKVITTTTTTTTYAPIPLPPLPPPSVPSDPKLYPLLNASLPPSLRNFPLVFPNGARATFREGDPVDDDPSNDEIVGGVGWTMVKKEETTESPAVVGLSEAVERFGKKRAHNSDMMDVELPGDVTVPPPRKKARATPLPPISTMNAAAPPSPLPSPHGSPPPETIWPSAPPSGAGSPAPQAPLQPDLSLTSLMALPNLVNHFANLPPALQSHFLLTLLRHSPLPVLRTLHSVLTPTLARDFITMLPPELVSHILSYLPFATLARASRVSKAWRAIIDSDAVLWRDLLQSTKIWFGGESETAFANSIFAKRRRMLQAKPSLPKSLPLPHPYKMLFKSRHLTWTRWVDNQDPKHISVPAHGSSVVTCLIFSHGRIISASDDHSIHVYSPETGELIRQLKGHDGGVWALAATKDTLVSGSTDRTVRIWDLNTGRCTHIFGGHTSTVRCLAIVKPEMINVDGEDGVVRKEKWPKRPLIVTGSRDHSLRVWTLPKPEDPEYKAFGGEDHEVDPSEFSLEETAKNPYHRVLLEGHDHAVRALAARGRTMVSGSYDCSVRIWDIIDGTCKWALHGHTQKVYSVVLDLARNQACSGSMDGTVRVWNLSTGACSHTLTGHTSLVGLLGLSSSHLVSAAADSTLRIWHPETGELQQTLAAHTGAITCFQHDEFKVLSGSDGNLKMWNIRDGTVVRDLLTGITGVWQVVFQGRWCVAASNRQDTTVIDIWDFGKEEGDEDWVEEPHNGIYDDDEFTDDGDDDEEANARIRRFTMMGDEDEDEEDEDDEQADIDAMDQDLVPSESESILEIDVDDLASTSSRASGSRRTTGGRGGSRSREAGGSVGRAGSDIEIEDEQVSLMVDAESSHSAPRVDRGKQRWNFGNPSTSAAGAGASSSSSAPSSLASSAHAAAAGPSTSTAAAPSGSASQHSRLSASSQIRQRSSRTTMRETRDRPAMGLGSYGGAARGAPSLPAVDETPTRPRIRTHPRRR